VFATRSGRQMLGGMDGGDEGVDDRFVAQGDVGIGATVMGRNMFGPIRGPWTGGPDGYVCTELVASPSVVRLSRAAS
jgi:hypothetical protein